MKLRRISVVALAIAAAAVACSRPVEEVGAPYDAGTAQDGGGSARADAIASGDTDGAVADARPRYDSGPDDFADAVAPPGFSLAFEDRFVDAVVDPAKWKKEFPWGPRNRGNNEAQIYVDDAFELGGGVLRIRAERRLSQGFSYTSGILTTHGAFDMLYGHVEARVRVPRGRGLWPAVWLLPTSLGWPPEIDVMEVLGQSPSYAHLSNHYGTAARPQTFTRAFRESEGPDFSETFHTFAVTWTPSRITWAVDGAVRATSTSGVPHERMYVLVNLAVGGDWPGEPDDTTPFPSYLDVDYVRAFTMDAPDGGIPIADAGADGAGLDDAGADGAAPVDAAGDDAEVRRAALPGAFGG